MGNYVTSHQVNFGKRVLPIKRVELFSSDEWEEFIEEWLDLKKGEYLEIERLGGAGDQGRDVVAYISKAGSTYTWDCYQCKHYDQALAPTKVYIEFGKILYYTFIREYPIPRKYYFVAPKGCGTSLSKMLLNTDFLKEEIRRNWDAYCKKQISETEDVLLVGNFLEYFNNFDFSIFSKVAVKNVIEEHSKHNNHIVRFGGGLPERERLDESAIPNSLQHYENRYIKQLLLAYGSENSIRYLNASMLENTSYISHFRRARINFHYAEQLRNFTRDNLPLETFQDFQNEIYNGVIDTVEENHESGFKKVKEVEKLAKSLNITSNPLKDVSVINDRSGICHQLVNDSRITWINEE